MKDSEKKNIPQEIIYADMQKNNNEKSSKTHVIFHIGIVLLNICMLALFWVLISNKYGVVKNRDVWDSVNWKYVTLLLVIPIGVIFLQVTRDYISLFKRNKRRRFAGILFASLKEILYNSYSKLGGVKYVLELNSYNIDKRSSVDLNYRKRISRLIARIIYATLIFVLGTIFCIENTNVLMVILGVLAFVLSGSYLCFLLYSLSHMDKCVEVIARLSKLLYKLRIIKDYEGFFKRTSSVLYESCFAIKQLSKMSILSVIVDMLILFLRHFGLFVIFQMLNFGGWDYFIWILFSCTILDLIIDLLPMPKGTLLFELLFATLFVNVFFSGYLPWAMVMFRVLDYFSYIIISLVILLFQRKRGGVSSGVGEEQSAVESTKES